MSEALGGGRLGPDLTKVYERLQGRKALSVWLSAPATPTMQAVFRNTPLQAEEILPLVAYLEEAARQGGEDTGVGMVTFLLLGLGGAVILLVGDGWRMAEPVPRRPRPACGRGGLRTRTDPRRQSMKNGEITWIKDETNAGAAEAGRSSTATAGSTTRSCAARTA